MPMCAAAVVDTVVKNIVFHRIIKSDEGLRPALRDNPNEMSPTTQKVVNLLIGEYGKRTGKAHGHFEEDLDNYPVQSYLQAHFIDKKIDFITMTSSMMLTLCAKAKGTAATTGGGNFCPYSN